MLPALLSRYYRIGQVLGSFLVKSSAVLIHNDIDTTFPLLYTEAQKSFQLNHFKTCQCGKEFSV